MLNQPGWIYLDKEQVESFRRLVITSESEDTVDQLGFGLLTKEVSDALFPWCSTLTTRARYFILSTAILQIALERTVTTHRKKNGDQVPAQAELRDLGRQLQKELQRLETIVAISLYAQYRSSNELGIFGKRNLDQRNERQLGKVLTKDLLSAPNRYPNAIYRGGLTELGLFTQASSSNTWAIQLLLNQETPFDLSWINAAQGARLEVEKLEIFWLEIANKSETFDKSCEGFQSSTTSKRFRGFRLSDPEKIHLKERILLSSPYLKPLENKKNNLIPLRGNMDVGYLSQVASSDWTTKLKAANDVNTLISHFQNMYLLIAKNQEAQVKNRVYPFLDIKKAHKSLSGTTCFSQLTQVLDIIAVWSPLLEKKSGRVSDDLIFHLKDRAERIVGARNKIPPHLLNKKQKAAAEKKEIGAELDIDTNDSGFRLGRATMILRDIFGANNAG